MAGTDGGRPGKKELSRRGFLRLTAAIGLWAMATACKVPLTPLQEPTPIVEPALTPLSPTLEAPRPIPTVEGPTIPGIVPGETLAMGGANWEIKSFDGNTVYQNLGQSFADWQIVTNPDGQIFNLTYTDSEGRFNLILPHASEGYQWDAQNRVWLSPDGKQVFLSNVALPGGFDEEKKIAGPTDIPSLAVLAKSPDDSYHVVVVYPKETASTLNNPNLVMTNTGDFALVGVEKILPLSPGQKVERDSQGYLRLVKKDGSYYIIKDSWDQVKNSQEVEQLFKPTGPIAEYPEVPYPAEKTVQAAVVPFANAFGVKPEEVVLRPELGTAVDGTQFVVLTTSDLSSTAGFNEDGSPLLIAEQKDGVWGWREIRLNAPNKYGITVTTHIESSVEFWKEDGFWQTGGSTGRFVEENYSGVAVPFFWHQIYSTGETGDYNLSKAYVKLTNGMKNPELIGGSLLYGEYVPEWLKSMPVEKQHQIMLDKITEMMTTFPQIKNWIVVNEPNSYGDYWYKTFGKQYIIDAFKRAHEVNPSANLILNGLDLDQSSNLQTISNENIIVPLIQDLKNQGLINEVGIEAHIDASKRIPTESELIQYFQSVHEKTGLPVRISELDVDIRSFTATDRLQKQASIYELIIRAYIKSGVGTNINTWGIKDKDSWRENPVFGGSKNADADLFDDQGNPKAAYFAVLKALFSSNP